MTDHLLQSTLFAAVAGLTTLAFRKNHARTRHWLWLAASLKFLLPFSLLVTMGSRMEWRTAPAVPPSSVSIVMVDAALPAGAVPRAPVSAPVDWRWPLWFAGSVAVLVRWWIRWRRAAAILRGAGQAGAVSGAPVYWSRASTEPAVFGIFHPKLVLPEGILTNLPAPQREAVIAHELCHVRHRDNLAAAAHMLVEALFWFHPLVWWIGARLVEERERACDEEVIQGGGDPEVYAAGILAVCRLCLESPLPCAAGITGADLRERIERILSARVVRRLDRGRKLLLAGIGAAAVCGPVAVGLWEAPRSHAQERNVPPVAFEVASVKLLPEPKNWPWPDGFAMTPKRSGGRIDWVTSTRALIYYAYHVQRWQASLPAGLHDSFYRIDAKTEESATDAQVRLMFQTLLKDRFRFAAHRETREMDGYALTVAKSGPKLKEFKDSDEPAPMPDYLSMKSRAAFEHRVIISKEGDLAALTGRRVSMPELAQGLQEEVQTFVLDQTGMPGNYYFGTKFVHVNEQRDVDGPSLFAALQEVLGLRLERQKGPVEVLVVDHVEKTPSEN